MEKQKAVLVRGNIICAEEVTWIEEQAKMPIIVRASEEDIAKYDIMAEFGGDIRCDKDMIAHGISHGMVIVTGDVIAYMMDFGMAIAALKAGKKVARMGWNGKGMHLWLKPETMVKAEWCKDPKLKQLAEERGGEIPALGTICMLTAHGEILTGWLASQSDMLATDWEVVA